LPEAPLIYVGGQFYGTTAFGGASQCGCGTVFTASLSGALSTLYSFNGGSGDSSYPAYGGLIEVGGVLYGIGTSGGVFSVTFTGAETSLHIPGGDPLGGLTNIAGVLYGTTYSGGRGNNVHCQGQSGGCGIVFQITTSGNLTILHNFPNPQMGFPAATMLYNNDHNALYGTTYGQLGGYGAVFKITP
jgi:uncharacterized repeat protein (TIGR03803 family)